MGCQHLFRVGRNEPKESEDEILMKEARMVSNSLSQTIKNQQRTNQKYQYLQQGGEKPAGEGKINWESYFCQSFP